MNVFASSYDPQACAISLDNRRVVKMLVETAQILATGMRLNGLDAPYQMSYKHHPVCVWAGESLGNRIWLAHHLDYLIEEYKYRYNGKTHLTAVKFEKTIEEHKAAIGHINHSPVTKFRNCARNIEKRLDFSRIDDVHEAYRLYLIAKWELEGSAARWSKRSPPEWYKKSTSEKGTTS